VESKSGRCENVEGFGDMWMTEPTTLCDIVKTLVEIREAPEEAAAALAEVENFMKQVGIMDPKVGHYDEDGNWTPPCPARCLSSYATFYPKGAGAELPFEKIFSFLDLNIGDAKWDYQKSCPSLYQGLDGLQSKIKEVREKLDQKAREEYDKRKANTGNEQVE